MNYECHLTLPLEHKAIGERVALSENAWKTSEIERDPVLGKGSHFYLTTHDSDLEYLFARMRAMAHLLKNEGAQVIREKIELIVYDSRSK